jgi:signal transduction histidine kinase
MSQTVLILLIGAVAGLGGAVIGGVLLYQNRLKAHLAFRDRVEEERTALQEEISEIDQEELSQTDAGKGLMAYSQASIRKLGYPRENPLLALRRHNIDLLRQIDEQKRRLVEGENRLRAMQQEAGWIIENLRKENTELRLSKSLKHDMASTSSAQLEQDLRSTLAEVARLQNQLAEANMRLIEVEAGGIPPFTQELGQTLSDNLESLDLLLDESVGSLNPVQRNLLDTMKASTARLRESIEDLIQLTTFKTSPLAATRESAELSAIVKDAVGETGSQIRAKRISLNIDLPEKPGSVYVNREALRQIFIRLLSNATAVSPLQGTVGVRVQTKVNEGKEYLLIQVSDKGGGIPQEDLSRVFTPLYRAEDVPARGVSDRGMGLFVAKTLTEAQNGRIWVDTEPGIGSIYNVLIPIDRDKPVSESVDK